MLEKEIIRGLNKIGRRATSIFSEVGELKEMIAELVSEDPDQGEEPIPDPIPDPEPEPTPDPDPIPDPIPGPDDEVNKYGYKVEYHRGVRHIYSELQPFSDDNSQMIVTDGNGYALYDVAARSVVKKISGAPRWAGNEIFSMNDVEGVGITRTLHNPSFQSPSRDGSRVAIAFENPGGTTMIGVWDIAGKEMIHSAPLTDFAGGGIMDWVQISPDGESLVFNWAGDGSGAAKGVSCFKFDGAVINPNITTHHNHGCIGVDPTGGEFYATTEYEGPYIPQSDTSVVTHSLADPNIYNILEHTYWGRHDHISATGGPGVPVVVTAGNAFANQGTSRELSGTIWMRDYVSGETTILADHGSTISGYLAQPQAAISLDGKRVAFGTDLGQPGDVVMGIIHLP